jgi:hypothetical protein
VLLVGDVADQRQHVPAAVARLDGRDHLPDDVGDDAADADPAGQGDQREEGEAKVQRLQGVEGDKLALVALDDVEDERADDAALEDAEAVIDGRELPIVSAQAVDAVVLGRERGPGGLQRWA